jgi:hypothetical protein
MSRTEESEFKGHPTITVFTGREYQGKEENIILGLRKATAIVDEIDAIRRFVDKHERK